VTIEFGIFGGSFDPPHLAHTLLIDYAQSAYELERVLVVPTYSHAFGKRLAPYDDRVRMCELACAEMKRVEVSRIESELPTPSLSVNTIEALSRRFAGVRLRFLIGADILAEAHAWHDFERIERLAPPLVIQRQGRAAIDPRQPALPDISSTEVRRRLRHGESTEGLLAPAVARYALARSLYLLEEA
jgi:nicotinate-nucleotide adenylyltransferase